MTVDARRCPSIPPWHDQIAVQSGYLALVARVIEKQPDGSAVLLVPPGEAAGLEVGASVEVLPAATDALPWPFGALAGKYPPFEMGEIEAARREAQGAQRVPNSGCRLR